MAHTFITRIGQTCGWLLFALVVVQFIVVLARYVFGVNYLWAQETAIYLYGAIFMLGSGWALLADRHVRIDVISGSFNAERKRKIDVFGLVFLLLPMMAAILFSSLGYVSESWVILESSPEVSGLGGRYLFKSLIPIFAVLMLVAAVTRIVGRS